MVQRAGRTRLFCKTASPLRVAGEVWQQQLDCHIAIEPLVGGAPDLANGTGSEQVANGIGTQTFALSKTPSVGGHRTGQPLERRPLEKRPRALDCRE